MKSGDRHGSYRVLRRLGQGSLAEVFLVEHVELQRREALKILHPQLADSERLVARFRREARATNRVRHPNVVGVYDFGQLPDSRLFLTIEYADGESLASVLEAQGQLPIPRVLRILGQLVSAIDHAHRCDVIHRDLTPHNLMLLQVGDSTDVLKVLDFGLAKIVAEEYPDTFGATTKGEVFGTAAYMAPEQLEGAPADPRMDIYSIGCVAFELVAGQPPFTGRPMEVLHAHVTEPPPRPSSRRPEGDVPAELEALILRCLDKNPDRRFQSGNELLRVLQRVPGLDADDTRPRAVRAPPRRSRRTTRGFGGEPTDLRDDTTEPSTGASEPERTADGPLARTGPLVDLGEVLIDLGCQDVDLIVDLARAAELRERIEQHADLEDDLESALAAAEDRAGRREATLRFALAEIRFERARLTSAGGNVGPDVRQAARSIEDALGRVASDLERDGEAIFERRIALATERAAAEDELVGVNARLERRLRASAARFHGHAGVSERLDRLAGRRALPPPPNREVRLR